MNTGNGRFSCGHLGAGGVIWLSSRSLRSLKGSLDTGTRLSNIQVVARARGVIEQTATCIWNVTWSLTCQCRDFYYSGLLDMHVLHSIWFISSAACPVHGRKFCKISWTCVVYTAANAIAISPLASRVEISYLWCFSLSLNCILINPFAVLSRFG